MSCIEQMKYDLLLERVSFKEAKEFIEKNSDEVYYVDPGYKIFKDYYINRSSSYSNRRKGGRAVIYLCKTLPRHFCDED